MTHFWALQIAQGDALARMRELPDRSVDLIVTDPPYESLEKHRKVGTTTRLTGAWFPTVPNAYFAEWFAEAWRVLAKNSHLYLHCDVETSYVIRPYAIGAGFRHWNDLTWDKGRVGMGYHYRKATERVMFFEKGKRKLANFGKLSDLIRVPMVIGGYPTEKPAALERIFIEASSLPGELVLDPFCGSGAVGEAALGCGRRFLGIDLTECAVRHAWQRLGGHGTLRIRRALPRAGDPGDEHDAEGLPDVILKND